MSERREKWRRERGGHELKKKGRMTRRREEKSRIRERIFLRRGGKIHLDTPK